MPVRLKQELDAKVRAYCDNLSSHGNKCMVASSCFFAYSKIHSAHNGSPYNVKWADELEYAFENKLKCKVNEKPIGASNHLGHCAEQHAANLLLKDAEAKKVVGRRNIKKIHFSPARRPKTQDYIPACRTCRKLLR